MGGIEIYIKSTLLKYFKMVETKFKTGMVFKVSEELVMCGDDLFSFFYT